MTEQYAKFIDIPNWKQIQVKLIDFKKRNFPTNGWVWYCYFEDQVRSEIPELIDIFESMNLKMKQMILFDNLYNDLSVTDHNHPLSIFIHTDSEDKEDTVGEQQPAEVEFSTNFSPDYAINIPMENCEGSLTLWYEFVRDTDQHCYYPHYDCGGHKHDAVKEVHRFELTAPAVLKIGSPHGVHNPHKERRSVATFRFHNDISFLIK